jgi:hypothetical protein
MSKSIVINHVLLQGAPGMLAEVKQSLAGGPDTGPLASFGYSTTLDRPGVLWLSFATEHVMTARDTEALVASVPGINLQHLLIDPASGWSERRCLSRRGGIQAAELSPNERDAWLRATRMTIEIEFGQPDGMAVSQGLSTDIANLLGRIIETEGRADLRLTSSLD